MEKNTAAKLIKELKTEINKKGMREKYVLDKSKDFTRNRELSMADTILYVLGNTRQVLELSTEEFCKAAQLNDISGAAVCKARAKIKYTAFEFLFEKSVNSIPITEQLKGYQIIAVDGMIGELPRIPELMNTYKVSSKKLYPQFHAMAAYDVLNEIFLAADFLPAPANEREMALSLLEHPYFQNTKQQIFVYDRGFPSVALIQKLNKMGKKFIMRVSSSFLREVNEFSKGSRVEQQMHIHYDKRRGTKNRVHALLPYDFDIRCVRIHLSSGEDEICITNLDRKTFPKRTIKHLYCLRWNVETGFNYLKNAIFVEEFSSKKDNGIKQDFYASLWANNLVSVIITEGLSFHVKKN